MAHSALTAYYYFPNMQAWPHQIQVQKYMFRNE